jgi:TolB-like protein/tetratricopeptide (TPR) repeat protein
VSRRIRFDCYEVDLAGGQVYKRGVRLPLREQSFRVLASLVERPGQAVTREDLRRQLWPDEVFVDYDNILNSAVARLREALGDSANQPRFIETLPKHGYRFIAAVSEPIATEDRAPARTPRLLVLPFVNSSGDPAQEYFIDAVTDEIITELAALAPGELAVIARTTSMRYKGTHKDLTGIGRELTVDYVVEGAARRVDDRVGMSVQLVRVSDQTHVFAQRFDADLGDIFSVYRSVAQAVGTQIGIPAVAMGHVASTAVAARPLRKPPADLVAYNCYIQGRYLLERPGSPEGWVKAREHLEAAFARDPQFALAYDGLAELWWVAGFFGMISPKDALPHGTFNALRAVEIDSNLAEAHALLAQYRKQVDYNWDEVRREFALALELNPASPTVLMRYATTGLMPFGRVEEAAAALERAIELDPLAMHPRFWLEIMLWLGRRYDRAIVQGQLAIELAPAEFVPYYTIGLVYREVGMFDQAIAALRKAVDLSGGGPLMLGALGLALAQSGDKAGARALLERLRAMPPKVFVPPTSFAWIHIGLGEIDEFFEWMDRAIDERDHMITPIKTYPFFDPVRDDPRYLGLLRRMNLA